MDVSHTYISIDNIQLNNELSLIIKPQKYPGRYKLHKKIKLDILKLK